MNNVVAARGLLAIVGSMEAKQITEAVADISGEKDPTIKCIKLASLCGALWKERGVELIVVGGSAIEITEGAHTSGDLDLCHATSATLPFRERVALEGGLGMDWNEVLRVANLREYRNVEECKLLVNELCDELKIKSPFHPA